LLTQAVAPAPTPGVAAMQPTQPLPPALSSGAVDTQRPGDLGAPAAEVQPTSDNVSPCLLVISQDGTTGRSHQIGEGQTDIGRAEGDIILPDDRFVSLRHARILRDGNRLAIQDLASVNGVYKRVTGPIPLENGDVFLVGVAVLEFVLLSPSEQNLRSAVERGVQVFGAPPRPRYARLSEQTMEGAPGSIFVVSREETILGREVGDIVFSSDPFMSRRHAAITRSSLDGTFSLLDLGSSNGTFIRIRGQVELSPGDHIRIGQHLFRYDSNSGQAQEQAQAR